MPCHSFKANSSCSCANLKSTVPTTAGSWSGDQEGCRESTDQEDRGTPSRRDREPVHQGGGSRSDEAGRRADCDRVEQRSASPSLAARERGIVERYTARLAELLAEETGAEPGDIVPISMAGALMTTHRALVS